MATKSLSRLSLELEQLENRIFLDANPVAVTGGLDLPDQVDQGIDPVATDPAPDPTTASAPAQEPAADLPQPDPADAQGDMDAEQAENAPDNTAEAVASAPADDASPETTTPDEDSTSPAETGSSPAAESILSDQETVGTAESALAEDSTASGTEVTDPLLGESFTFTVNLDNPENHTLYGPYIDLYFEGGASDTPGDEATPSDPDNDGIIFESATYLSTPLNTTVLTYDGTTPLLHPYAVDSNGDPLEITSKPDGTPLEANDTVVVLEMPFGSYTPEQPAAPVEITAHISNYSMVDLNQGGSEDLEVQVSTGFRYGTDPLDNPSVDPSVTGLNVSSQTFRPDLLAFEKVFTGPEQETSTGPNYVQQYKITIDIADGHTIDDLVIIDRFPNEIYYLGNVNVSGSSGYSGNTTVRTYGEILHGNPDAANYSDGHLEVALDSPITGTAAGDDLVITFDFYVPEFYADETTPILGGSCNEADTPVINDASISGNWTPMDPDDQGPHSFSYDSEVNLATGQFGTNPANDEQFSAQSLSIQKSVSLETDNNAVGYSPGDIVRYDLSFQVSDYLSFGDLELTDILHDGLVLSTASGHAPILTVSEQGGASQQTTIDIADASEFASSPYSANGFENTLLEFHLSQALDNDNAFTDSILEGGHVNGGTLGATTGTLTYWAVIQDNYTTASPGNDSVDQGDVLPNQVVLSGNVYGYDSNGNLIPVPQCPEDDDSSAAIAIATGQISKSIYAINGNTSVSGTPHIQPGDEVTYQLTYDLVTNDVELFSISDYLPKPVFDATDVIQFDGSLAGTIPGSGVATFGPNDTFFSLSQITPTLTTSASGNSVTFSYGDYDAPEGSSATTVDLLFTVTVSNDPFTDGLYLTNMVVSTESATSHVATDNQEIVQFILDQPNLSISKGIVETAGLGPDGVLGTGDDDDPGTLTDTYWMAHVSEPGSSGFRFDTPVTSADLAAHAMDADLSDVDAADVVTYALAIENSGHFNAFDIRLRDELPDGVTVADVSNLQVTDGEGTVLHWTGDSGQDVAADLFSANGIELIDSSGYGDDGLENVDNANGGHNIVLITYDLALATATTPPWSPKSTPEPSPTIPAQMATVKVLSMPMPRLPIPPA